MSDTLISQKPRGILAVLDSHIDDKCPSSRMDDYAETTLYKFDRCIDIANEKHAVVALAGDVFNRHTFRSEYVKSRFMAACYRARHGVYAIPGNHDISGDTLGPEDCLWTMGISRCLKVIRDTGILAEIDMEYQGENIRVGLGGTPYGKTIPQEVIWNSPRTTPVDFGVWLSHDNFPFETCYNDSPVANMHGIANVDLVINGHLHHASHDVSFDDGNGVKTRWSNPGALTRTKANEKDRNPVAHMIYPNGVQETIIIDYPGMDGVFSASAGRASAPVEVKKESRENRFISLLQGVENDEKSIGELLDEAVTEGRIDRNMRQWLEGVAIDATS